MEKKLYSHRDLCEMSYQDLRRISILFRLPANIKKKYMISMIQAHQKGDGMTKTAIANKVLEERNMKRLSIQMKRSKPFILTSGVRTHQVSADLSVATKHEFETRYSYVAHYTKENKGSGISEIIREEAEVSRKNRSVVQQTTKSSRKLTAGGRTEIMLPRNHSLTTLVQLMPQNDRNFMSSSKSPPAQVTEHGWCTGNSYYQDSSSAPDYPVQGGFSYQEYGNSHIPSSSHDLYRNWHARELYNSVVSTNLKMAMLPGVLSSQNGALADSGRNRTMSSSFQRQYESYVGCSGSSRGFMSSERDANSSTSLVSNYNFQDSNTYSFTNRTDIKGNEKEEGSGEYEQYPGRRFDGLIRHGSEGLHSENLSYLVDIFIPRSDENPSMISGTAEGSISVRSSKTLCMRDTDSCELSYPLLKIGGNLETDAKPHPESQKRENFIQSEVPEFDLKYRYANGQPEELPLPSFVSSFVSNFHEMRIPDPCPSESGPDSSPDYRLDHSPNENRIWSANLASQRIISGQFSNSVRTYSSPVPIPLFMPVYALDGRDRAYAVCRNSWTGTTSVHGSCITFTGTTSGYGIHHSGASWCGSELACPQSPQQVIINNNVGHYPRSLYYAYPEEHEAYNVETHPFAGWSDYNREEMDAKMAVESNEVRMVECKRHGYHYVNTLPNA